MSEGNSHQPSRGEARERLDQAVAVHLRRRARGKSVRFLANRYLRALQWFLEDCEAEEVDIRYETLPVLQAAALRLVTQVCNERVRRVEAIRTEFDLDALDRLTTGLLGQRRHPGGWVARRHSARR